MDAVLCCRRSLSRVIKSRHIRRTLSWSSAVVCRQHRVRLIDFTQFKSRLIAFSQFRLPLSNDSSQDVEFSNLLHTTNLDERSTKNHVRRACFFTSYSIPPQFPFLGRAFSHPLCSNVLPSIGDDPRSRVGVSLLTQSSPPRRREGVGRVLTVFVDTRGRSEHCNLRCLDQQIGSHRRWSLNLRCTYTWSSAISVRLKLGFDILFNIANKTPWRLTRSWHQWLLHV